MPGQLFHRVSSAGVLAINNRENKKDREFIAIE
jgi:hypothetical protein